MCAILFQYIKNAILLCIYILLFVLYNIAGNSFRWDIGLKFTVWNTVWMISKWNYVYNISGNFNIPTWIQKMQFILIWGVTCMYCFASNLIFRKSFCRNPIQILYFIRKLTQNGNKILYKYIFARLLSLCHT